MNYEEIYKEINRQSYGSSFVKREINDIFQGCFIYLYDNFTLEESVKNSIKDNKSAIGPKRGFIHLPIYNIDVAEEEIKPLAIKKSSFNDRKKRRIYNYFDDLEKVTGILNYLDYSFRVLRPEKKTYNEAIQLNESCPVCQHKKCFTIYENDSEDRVKNIAKFSYSCHTSGKDHDYKLYPNNLDGIFMLLLEKPQKNVRKAVSRIIQELS
jgi:hypothetical protein